MCNPFKAIKKFFKKVVKAASIIVPVVLGAAAIYFTVGAALGITGTAGGWLSSTLGLSGTLGSVVAGAVTQAGYGALLGGATAAITGGDIGKGLLVGAGAGAITGGITGRLTAPVSAPAAAAGAAGAPSNLGLASGSNKAFATSPTATPPVQTASALSQVGDFVTKNQTLVGGAIQGLGAGIGGFAEAGATVEAANILADRDREEQERIARNFALSGRGLLSSSTPDTTPRPTPGQQFNPANRIEQEHGAMWRYNPVTQKLELS